MVVVRIRTSQAGSVSFNVLCVFVRFLCSVHIVCVCGALGFAMGHGVLVHGLIFYTMCASRTTRARSAQFRLQRELPRPG